MKSKTSFINRGILHHDFKSFGWIGAAYLLGLLMALPLKVLMLYSRGQNHGIIDANAYLRIFDYSDSGLVIILLILMPILTGLWLFKYLQSDNIADMVHALPIKRETLFNTHILAGIIYLFVPLVITALVSWALVGVLGIAEVNGLVVLKWLGISMLFNLLFFIATVFTGICTGISTLQGILSMILLLLPTGLFELLIGNAKIFIYGFAREYYSANTIYSPLLRISQFSYSPIKPGEIALYLLAALAFYFLGRYLYQRRHIERAGNAVTFDILRPIFKYGVTFCFMLLLGVYFYESQANSIAWTYFGYLLGSLLAYFAIEILLTKSLRIFNRRTAKGYTLYLLFVILLVFTLTYDLTGFEKKLPELAEIESVYLDQSFYPLRTTYNVSPTYAQGDYYEYAVKPLPAIFKDSNNISNIYAFHQSIISNHKRDLGLVTPGDNRSLAYDLKMRGQIHVSLAYKLKNGSHIYRQYTIPTAEYKNLLKPIFESREYKELHNTIFRTDSEHINTISITANGSSKHVTIIDPLKINQAIEVLKQDLLRQSYEEMTDQRAPWADITLVVNNRRGINLSWDKSFSGFEEWLIINDYYNQARLIPEQDIDYAIVEINSNNNDEVQRTYNHYKTDTDFIKQLEQKPGTLKITDINQLETCLRNYTDYDRPEYFIYFQLKNGSTFMRGFSKDFTPDFVQEHFSK